jgi:DNA repair ATPase RecN
MKWVLRSISTSAGFLEQAPIKFSEKLTCIIGARGTCKSTIIETLRFAFDCDSDRVQQLTDSGTAIVQSEYGSSRGLVYATLQDGTVRCELTDAQTNENSVHILERTIGSKPRLFRDGVQLVEAGAQLNRIEIYSQGDLQRIAEQPARRLHLIDRPNQDNVDKLTKLRSDATEKLRELGPAIRRTRSEIESRKNIVKSLDGFRKELEHIQGSRPQLSRELNVERQGYMSRKDALDRVRSASTIWEEVISGLESNLSREGIFRDIAQECTGLAIHEGHALADAFSDIAKLISRTAAELTKIKSHVPGVLLEGLEQFFEQQNVRYYELRREQQEVNESLKKEDTLRIQIQRLEEVQRELDVIENEYRKLTQQRRDLRQQIERAGEQLYSMRLQQVEEINSSYGDLVLLTLGHGSRSEEQRTVISSLLAGSRIRNQDEVAADLADKMQSSDLVDSVEAGDSKRLADALGRDLGQMTRLVSYLLDNPKLYQLEGIICDDQLEITLFVEKEPKPINQLSKGQMATALLPLILRAAPYPLIFDQPEDDLDNAFIFSTLIGRICKLKSQRQLIFVTHNANIPVLGDAETVVVMTMHGPRKAEPPVQGDVDVVKESILLLLEGGREAFMLRQQRYSDALVPRTEAP